MKSGLICLFVSAIFCTSMVQSEDNHGRKKLSDLNFDVLSLICDELDIADMMKLIEAYPENVISVITKQSFWRRFKDYVIFIDETNHHEFIVLDNIAKRITIYPTNCANVIEVFGDLIQDLDINIPSNETIQIINKYASESLINLKLKFASVDIFESLTTPFTALEGLEVQTYDFIKIGRLQLNELFPQLRRLSLDFYGDNDFSFIFYEFPHLEHFHLYRPFDSRDEEMLANFFQKNPQIESLDVEKLNQKWCNIINEHVPQLKNLTVETHNIDIEDDTTFEHVKSFQIKLCEITPQPKPMDKLSMPKLEFLQITLSKPIAAVWTEFFRKHQHVKHLKIIDACRSDDQSNQLIEELPHLIEISFSNSLRKFSDSVITFENVNRIIETHSNLVKLSFSSYLLGKNEMDNVQSKFENDWNIIAENYDSDKPHNLVNVYFDKKN